MFIELKLKNFRKHLDRVFNFEQGVIALRGANEDGKTTMLEGIGYALGGARMLREPLDDVVTWGQKVGTLKVWLTFTINDVTYTITRSKAGAEIATETQIMATGQDEVTKFVETLLGCTVKTATQLMLANQQKLRGTLEEDGAAVKLIEQLADFQLIDRVVALVQKHLPCGTTATVEGRIKALEEQVAQPVEDETPPFIAKVATTTEALNVAGVLYETRKTAYDNLQQPAKDAQQRLDLAEGSRRHAAAMETSLAAAKATFAAINPVPGPAPEAIETLRKQVEDATRWNRAVAAHRSLQGVPEPAWQGPYSELVAERDKHQRAAAAANERASALQVQIGQKRAQKITQTACGLCGKDLSAVPEVVQKNNALDLEIVDLVAALGAAQREAGGAAAEARAYDDVITAGSSADRVFQTCAEFITLDRDFTPAQWTWTGPDVNTPPTNPAAEYQQAVNAVAIYQRELGRQQQARTAVEAAEDALAKAVKTRDDALAAVGNAQQVLDQAAAATTALFEAETSFRKAEQAARDAQRDLDVAQQLHAAKLAARQQVADQVLAAKKELADMEFNNELVSALRKARPSIVEELWNIVGATVSSTFSTIRGTPSTFVRDNDSFTVDGRGIKGLSGSTLDALGLAIRMSLTKTFLPNTRFMVLDEPAAAADEDRETNMLGVIASSEFDQVLLVTHSDLADSFASQVIRL